MFQWAPFPFLRFTIALILGLITGNEFSVDVDPIFFLSFFLIYLILHYIQKRKWRIALKPILGFFALFILFLFGIHVSSTLQETEKNDLPESTYQATVLETPARKSRSSKTMLEIQSARQKGIWKVMRSKKTLCYMDTSVNLELGDVILFHAKPKNISPPLNPNEFDYRTFLSRKGIHYQVYLGKDDVVKVREENDFNIGIRKLRNQLINKLNQHIISERESGLAQALILGSKTNLDPDLKSAYSRVGAMHVLAVSGLHVGLLYFLMVWLFKQLKYNGMISRPYVSLVFTLIVIWMYALVTGFSPSVVRASTMFSFILVGDALGRQSNAFNSVFASAFLLLWINPNMLFEVGFQLSYLAVLSILYLYPKIYGFFDLNNTFLDKLWSMTSVTLAAQIGTTPISILYFHQFPNYFMLSNLIVVPAASLILYLGIGTLILSWIPLAHKFLSYALEKVIWLTNEVMIGISNLPFSLSKDLSLDELEAILIYGVIMMFLVFAYTRKLKYYIFVFVVTTSFFAYRWHKNNTLSDSNHLMFYALKGHTAIGFQQGAQLDLWCDSLLIENKKAIDFHLKPHWLNNRMTNINLHQLSAGYVEKSLQYNNLLVIQDKNLLVYQHPIRKEFEKPLHLDYLIVHQNPWIDTALLNINFKMDKIILDGSNSYTTRSWLKQCYPDKVVDLLESGYFSERLFY